MNPRFKPLATSGPASTGTRFHACNCIGCCHICGTCRAAPWHTTAYCAQAEKSRERLAALAERESR